VWYFGGDEIGARPIKSFKTTGIGRFASLPVVQFC
jgi:hypothetical protein